jgi:uncharacterized protein YPO0396
MTNQRFEALSRICLNNWHYINRKTLSFNREINFFTGHSGSGKSTVIDAMQIVLYANTDGRGFFNKAAADDSDRNLIEYLRGMVNIGENNEFAYLRNQNFSSTIVLELQRTDTEECQCVGIVFDVDTSTNEIFLLAPRASVGQRLPDGQTDDVHCGGGRLFTEPLRQRRVLRHFSQRTVSQAALRCVFRRPGL